MTDLLDGVLADLAAEGAALDALVAELPADRWRLATPAAGWTIAHQVAHLAWTDHAAVLAAGDKAGWDELVLAAIEDPTGFVDRTAEQGSEREPTELLADWRTSRDRLAGVLAAYPAGEKLPWFGPPMSATSMATARFMETWAHGLDVAEALADAGLAAVPEPTDRVRHVCHLGVRTRDFAFATRELAPPTQPFRVELVAPSGQAWTWGPEDGDTVQRVSGPAYHFALLVTQRRHRDDLDLVAEGPDADAWLDIAQAFAGPPGGGRDPEVAR